MTNPVHTNPKLISQTMIIRRLTLMLSLVLTTALAFGQTARAFERAAEKAAGHRDFYSATRYLEMALEIDSSRTELLFQHAVYSKEFGAPGLAAYSFQKVLMRDAANFPQAWRGLAECEKVLGKYAEAIQHFQFFLEKQPLISVFEKEDAAREIMDCEWAMEMLNNPDPGIVIERLTELVNTENSEFAPVQKEDTLYFSSFRYVDWNDRHSPPRPIVKVMKSVGEGMPSEVEFNDPARHTAHTAFSPDGQVMVYTLCDYTGTTDIRCQLYFRKKVENGWSEAVALPKFINLDSSTTTQPNLAFGMEQGRLTLFFASDRPGGKGKMDIWTTSMNPDFTFTTPMNLSVVNTPGNDITPFFDGETRTLFYSTDGLRNLGGYDVFKTQIQFVGGPSADDLANYWSQPENLGLPFNSSGNDIYFMPQADGETTLFSSNRAGSTPIDKEACCYDIYKGKLLPLRLETLVFETQSQSPLSGVDVQLIELPGDPKGSQNTGGDNQADFEVGHKRHYLLIATKEGFLPDTVQLITSSIPLNRIFKARLYLDFPKKEAQKPEQEPDWNTKNPKLTPGWLSQFLPVNLYFDNDEPDHRTRDIVSKFSYDETYVKYISRKEEFIRVFSRGLAGEQKIQAQTELGKFFDRDVKAGYDRLAVFAKSLQRFIESGYSVEIIIKGYASPLAKNDYNQNLTLRRSNCVLNYMRKAEGGIYQKYIADGRLVLTTVGFGEEKAKAGIEDSPKNTRLSIFSPEASRERRAEIIEVKLLK